MKFAMPEQQYSDGVPDLAQHLRDLEQNAPKPTAKDIREGLLKAAQVIEARDALAETIACQLEEAANIRISEMASTSAVTEIQRGIKRTLVEAARRLREK